MVEKSIILRADEDSDFRSRFENISHNIDGFTDLDDDRLLGILKNGKGLSSDLANSVINNQLYEKIYEKTLGPKYYVMDDNFLVYSLDKSEELSDELSVRLSSHFP